MVHEADFEDSLVPVMKSGLSDSIPNVRLVALKCLINMTAKSEGSTKDLISKNLLNDIQPLTEDSEIDIDVNYFANILYAKLS